MNLQKLELYGQKSPGGPAPVRSVKKISAAPWAAEFKAPQGPYKGLIGASEFKG